jgi:hypothetical protein
MKLACVSAVLVVVVVFLPSLSARSGELSEDYYPLMVGSHWEYRSAVFGEMSMSIVGDQDILGVTTRVRRQVLSDQVFENYWSKDASGNVFLHGAVNFTYPFEAAYVPPIKVVEPPLFLGKAWVTNGIRGYNLDGTPWDDGPFDYPLRVYTEGVLAVPAGDFYSYGVGYDTPFGYLLTSRQGTFDVLGRRVAASQFETDNATEWYSSGVGVVQSCDYTDRQYAFKLVSFELPSVPTQAITWGRVKSLYGSD